MGDGEIERGSDFGLIQHGKSRAGHFAGEFAAVAGVHHAGAAGQLADGYGKVIPGAYAFVAVVVDAFGGGGGVENGADDICQVAGIGGCAHLVEHHIQARAIGHEAKHGFHEVLTMDGVEPGRADDDAAAAAVENGLFAREFGATVGTQRAGGHVFGAGGVAIAAEYIVGGDMDEQSPLCLGGGGQVGGSGGIDEVGYFFIVLCGVHVGIGGAVHNGTHALCCFKHSGGVGDVELCYIGEDKFVCAACPGGYAAHFIAQLSIGTCYENLHVILISFNFETTYLYTEYFNPLFTS